MGATAFRPRRGAGGQYKRRKAERMNGAIPKSRGHESPPWYCYPMSAGAYEAQITKERLEAEREKKIAAAEFERKRAEEIARFEKIQAKRAGMKLHPLSKLAGEGAPA